MLKINKISRVLGNGCIILATIIAIMSLFSDLDINIAYLGIFLLISGDLLTRRGAEE